MGLMNPAASNFSTSLTINRSISMWNIPSRLKFFAIKYAADKHSALLKFSRFCCVQFVEGSALWLLKLSATKYSANKHSALKFSRFCCEQSAERSAFCFLKLYAMKYFVNEHSAFLRFCCEIFC